MQTNAKQSLCCLVLAKSPSDFAVFDARPAVILVMPIAGLKANASGHTTELSYYAAGTSPPLEIVDVRSTA